MPFKTPPALCSKPISSPFRGGREGSLNGNRLIKTVTDVDNDPNHPSYDYYARDAQGNIMAIYTLKYNTTTTRWELMLDENEIYGSSRLGIDKRNKLISFYTGSTLPTYQSANASLTQLQNQNQAMINSAISEISSLGNASGVQYFDYQNNLAAITQWAVNNNYATIQQGNELFLSGNSHTNIPFHEIIYAIPLVHINKTTLTRTLGNKQFELTNHLGNVMATISDRKLSDKDNTNPSAVFQYYPQLISSQDYYAFGQQMPERSFSNDSYRFGFNGKEKVDEVYGVGNFQDYDMRSYETRVCRFISVDPITSKFPGLTPFQFASNRPIDGIDLNGKEWQIAIPASVVATDAALIALGVVSSGIIIEKAQTGGFQLTPAASNAVNLLEKDKSGTFLTAYLITSAYCHLATNAKDKSAFKNQEKQGNTAKQKANEQDINGKNSIENNLKNPNERGEVDIVRPPNKDIMKVLGAVVTGVLLGGASSDDNSSTEKKNQNQPQPNSTNNSNSTDNKKYIWETGKSKSPSTAAPQTTTTYSVVSK